MKGLALVQFARWNSSYYYYYHRCRHRHRHSILYIKMYIQIQDCLQYLHKHNCPITPEVYAYATKYGHTNCVNYLIDNNLIGTKA